MYVNQKGKVEDKCYTTSHVDDVVTVIKRAFPEYFEKYIENGNGFVVTEADFNDLLNRIGAKTNINRKTVRPADNYKSIIQKAVTEFEKDRAEYQDILDTKALDEYADDPNAFKKVTLRNQCPIIRKTLHSELETLAKYKRDFSMAKPMELLTVVRNLNDFAHTYYAQQYKADTYDAITLYQDLGFNVLDTEAYTVYGVIGGGIKSHMLYKVYPCAFPNRSREALWAMWYLTEQQTFGCLYDSEFLMIDTHKSLTQQNYFYPYALFAFYAHQIFQLLRVKAEGLGVYLDPDYRYVYVDSFLSSVAKCHEETISLFTKQLRDGNHDY